MSFFPGIDHTAVVELYMENSNQNSVFESRLYGLWVHFWTLLFCLLVFTLEGSWSGWSSVQLVISASLVIGGSQTSSLVTLTLVCKGGLVCGVVAGNSSSGLWRESASALVVVFVGNSTSVSSRSESDGDSSSLEGGRGMEMLLSVFTWGLLCSWFKAALLYVVGNLGLWPPIDAVEQALWGEVSLLEVELLDIRESDSVQVE